MDMPWREAITKVMDASKDSMHYKEISEKIVEEELRFSLGATPGATVNANISNSIKRDGVASPFVRVGRGEYILRKYATDTPPNPSPEGVETNDDDPKLIFAFGMYWHRNLIHWERTPSLLGVQQVGATPVDFSGQRGVYLLHDRREVVYVGRSIDRFLGRRLFEHTHDRLRGRWDRFSWFGLYDVTDEGRLVERTPTSSIDVLGATLESLLIEGLEPRQNRRRGDGFSAVEYVQAEDPRVKAAQNQQLLAGLMGRLGTG